MINNIQSVEALLTEAKDIQSFLDITCSEQVEEVIERGSALSVYIARTGKMLADAEYHRDAMLQSEVINLLKDVSKKELPPLTVNKFIAAACKDANYLATWFNRLNRTATHQLDWCRTLVSKAKEELRYAGGVSGSQCREEKAF